MNARTRYEDNVHEYPPLAEEEEELETGEPILEESEPSVAKKIPALYLHRKSNPSRTERAGQSEPTYQSNQGHQTNETDPSVTSDGRVVLSTAKYLKQNTDPEIERENRKKRRQEQEQRGGDDGAFALEKGVLNSGMMGGLAAMGIAVVWFLAGLMNDILFFYPPVLFVIGIFAFLNGLSKSNSE